MSPAGALLVRVSPTPIQTRLFPVPRNPDFLWASSAATLALVSWAWASHQEQALAELNLRQSQQARVAAKSQGAHAMTQAPPPPDYSLSLPTALTSPAPAPRLIESARSAAARHGVVFMNSTVQSQFSNQTAVQTSLDRVEVSLALRGEYGALKATLDEVLQRAQPALLRELSLARASATTSVEVEARAVIVLPLRPLPVAAGFAPHMPTPALAPIR